MTSEVKYIFDETKSTPLCEIMDKYGSDKGSINIRSSWHNYTTLYYPLFKDIQYKPLRVFEMGIGRLNKNLAGASLYGWEEFFPNSQIFGADIDTTMLFNKNRIHTFYCDQTNPDIIAKMWNMEQLKDNFDIIIEDGLHTFNANVCFFENSIHKVKPNGYYIIEDIANKNYTSFMNKIKEWQLKYKECSFAFLRIPSITNHIDNNLLIVHKLE